ncbi:MAG: phosphate ABC transporter substrate-binding protein PstS [Frankiaceae bacterium]
MLLALGGGLVLTGCGSDNTSSSSAGANPSIANCATGNINASGSTAQKNAMDTWVTNYQQACSGSTINYQPVGSGAGIQAFNQGSTAFAGSDSALKVPDEQNAANKRCAAGPAINLPMVAGPIAVSYNLPGITNLVLDSSDMANIFAGKITNWNQVKTPQPAGVTLPNMPIQAFHRSDSSGTTDNFTNYLKAAAPSDWTFAPGKEWTAPGGQGAKGSDGVTSAIQQTTGAIGYIEYSYAKNANLATVVVDTGAPDPVPLTPPNVANGVSQATLAGSGNNLPLNLNSTYTTKAPNAYPIVLVTYEITCSAGLPGDQSALVRSFLTYTASASGQSVLTDLGYAPLPQSIQSQVQSAAQSIG